VGGEVRSFGHVLDRLTLPPLPTLRGERVIVRAWRESDVDDWLRYPVDPEEEDGYGSAWRRAWDGRRYRTREQLAVGRRPPDPHAYTWAVEYDGRCIGSTGLHADPDQHGATYTVGLFAAGLRGRGLGREVTWLVLSWAFEVLGAHRIQLEVLAGNRRAINCYLACGFRREGLRREAELYPDGWKDIIMMGVLRSEYAAQAKMARRPESDLASRALYLARNRPGRSGFDLRWATAPDSVVWWCAQLRGPGADLALGLRLVHRSSTPDYQLGNWLVTHCRP
jgi:[ribosomal protein S5]-alanine N-acetyltransferase